MIKDTILFIKKYKTKVIKYLFIFYVIQTLQYISSNLFSTILQLSYPTKLSISVIYSIFKVINYYILLRQVCLIEFQLQVTTNIFSMSFHYTRMLFIRLAIMIPIIIASFLLYVLFAFIIVQTNNLSFPKIIDFYALWILPLLILFICIFLFMKFLFVFNLLVFKREKTRYKDIFTLSKQIFREKRKKVLILYSLLIGLALSSTFSSLVFSMYSKISFVVVELIIYPLFVLSLLKIFTEYINDHKEIVFNCKN